MKSTNREVPFREPGEQASVGEVAISCTDACLSEMALATFDFCSGNLSATVAIGAGPLASESPPVLLSSFF